jgi:hypothetical protein
MQHHRPTVAERDAASREVNASAFARSDASAEDFWWCGPMLSPMIARSSMPRGGGHTIGSFSPWWQT